MDGAVVDENFLFANFEDQPANKGKSKKSRKRKLSDCIIGEDGFPIVQIPEEISRIVEQKEKYIQQLEEQNNKLKAVIKRLCGPQSFTEKGSLWEKGQAETMPMAVVMYVNNELSFACKKDLEESMLTMISKGRDVDINVAMTQDPRSQPSAVPLRAFAVDTKGKRLHIAKNITTDTCEPHICSAVHYYLDFCIDRTGLPLFEQNPGITEIWAIPVYEQVFLNALPMIDDDGRKVFIRQRRSKHCFNCLGDHSVNQCDQPRDMAKINANRQEFLNKFGGSPVGETRYHQGEQERFKSFKAGVISESLREALSISNNELPPYIYKMRTLGYPPGYLKSDDSCLLMYGKEGQIQDSYDGEEGEIQPENFRGKIQYPGFNAPLEEGIIDRSTEYGMPPFESWYSFESSRSNFEETSSPQFSTPLNRQNHQHPNEAAQIRTGMLIDDMEIEDATASYDGNHHRSVQFYSNRDNTPPRIGVPPAPPNYTPERPPPPPDHSPTPPPLPNYTPTKQPPPPSHDPSESFGESPLTAIEIGEILDKAEMRAKKAKIIDSYLAQGQSTSSVVEGSSQRDWWFQEPLSDTSGILYFTYTPPPSLKMELEITDAFKYCAKDLDREPWKTDSTSWYDPLYGDLAAPTGIYDSIKEILKKRKKRQQQKKHVTLA